MPVEIKVSEELKQKKLEDSILAAAREICDRYNARTTRQAVVSLRNHIAGVVTTYKAVWVYEPDNRSWFPFWSGRKLLSFYVSDPTICRVFDPAMLKEVKSSPLEEYPFKIERVDKCFV